MSSETRNAFPSEPSTRFSQSLKESSQRKPPIANPEPEPVDNATEPLTWVSLAYPVAAAREEQIRRAAETGGGMRGGDAQRQAGAPRDPADWQGSGKPVADGRDADFMPQAGAGEGVSAGQTHDVHDPLSDAADAENWQEFEAVLTDQFAFVTGAIPTTQAVEDYNRALLAHSPRNTAFHAAATRAAGLFLVERPRRGAAEIEKVLREEGPVAAAAKLRRLTDHDAADPLSAGQIFALSKTSIDAIASHLCPAMSPQRIRPSAQQSQVFSDLSAAADSASRSSPGLQVAWRLADLLREAPIDTVVTASIGKGDGVILPLEIARLRVQHGEDQGADALALHIQVGIQQLRERTRRAVLKLDDAASLYMELMTRPDAGEIAEDGRQAHPEIVEDIDAQLAALNLCGYALARVMGSLQDTGPWIDRLANSEALRGLGALPDNEASPEVAFVVDAMPASVAEVVRQNHTDLLEAAGDPYRRLRDLAFALQWFQDFRRLLGAPSHLGAASDQSSGE